MNAWYWKRSGARWGLLVLKTAAYRLQASSQVSRPVMDLVWDRDLRRELADPDRTRFSCKTQTKRARLR